MIFIIISLLFALYTFWHFENRRKIRNAAYKREKREAMMDLLLHLQKKNDNKEAIKEEKNDA